MAEKMEDVLQWKRQLQKATTADETRVALKHLSTVEATQTLLSKTEIGVVVNRLRKHEDPNVAESAKALVRKWKADVEKDQKRILKLKQQKEQQKSSSSGDTQKIDVKRNENEGELDDDISPVQVDASDIRLIPTGPPRSVKSDGVEIPTTRDKIRDKCLEMLYTALATQTNAPNLHVVKRALEVESAAYALLAKNNPQTEAYREKIRSLFLNLRDVANPMLRVHVLQGGIDAQSLCTMSAEELKSKERLAEDQKLQEANLFAARGAAPQEAETDQFKCGKCKKRKCRYYQMQTRSADEPMTTFVTCVNCGNKWKFC